MGDRITASTLRPPRGGRGLTTKGPGWDVGWGGAGGRRQQVIPGDWALGRFLCWGQRSGFPDPGRCPGRAPTSSGALLRRSIFPQASILHLKPRISGLRRHQELHP